MSSNINDVHLPHTYFSRSQSRGRKLGVLLGSVGHLGNLQDQQHTKRPLEEEGVACTRRDSIVSTFSSFGRVSDDLQSASAILGFEVLDVWTYGDFFSKRHTVLGLSAEHGHLRNSHGKINLKAISPRVPLQPHGAVRTAWDLVTLLLVLYDCIAAPLQLLDPEITRMLSALNWLSRLVWMLDIFATANTGYLEYDGCIEMDRYKVIRRYVRSWFVFDASLCLVDWIDFGLSHTSDDLVHARIMSAMKFLRMARLLRLVRIEKVMATMIERIRSEKLILVAGLTKIFFLILVIPHVLACIWFALGRSDQHGLNTWIQASELAEKSLRELYLISFHWSLAQFSGLGFDEVHAQNMEERTFAIFVTFIAFAIASFVVSSLTSTMTRLQIVASKQSMQFTMLRRYLEEKGVSSDIKMRIMRTAQSRVKEQERFTAESDVNLLAHLSEPLKIQLHFELRSKTLSWHPFMKRFCSSHPEVMGKVCHNSVAFKSVSSGDVVFSTGEQPNHGRMLFVEDGTFTYRKDNGSPREVIVHREQWIAEAFLWTTWVHRGKLVAKGECRLLELDSEKFQGVVNQFPTAEVAACEYAKHFVQYLNEHEGAELDDLMIVPDLMTDDRRLSLNSQGPMTMIQQWFHAPVIPVAEGDQ